MAVFDRVNDQITFSSLLATNAQTINGNVSYVDTNHCDTHVGQQMNYTRCFNATGQMIETFGVFPV